MNKEKSRSINLDQLLIRAFYWMDQGLQLNLRERGGPSLTHSQSMILLTIDDGIHRPSTIAERLGISRQAVHQSLQELQKIEIVELVPDPNDRRAKLVKMRTKGSPAGKMAYQILRELEQELGARIGERDLKGLRRALEKDWGEPALLKD